ncbi:RagB/SusD family nutrient uptake outer membrane protein [Flavihumibacter stibioxidans]|uniref:Carbohydrate-binding protein SusD n=1 Tax=Flavihumibacter stibioxidans TaxID=1834163 RepID=A0ABR7M9A0_9BACT|nr:RagB/SusD family nutrient uptake outer membrane protein [Flavihumibacter stibioxidans]MBC6491613.1 carbohydrate-binding protein SusD [Flavihumibacter stibioxidans]
MKRRILYMAVAAGVLQLTACKKEDLEPVPTNVISELSAFDTELRIRGQVNGLYATIKNAGMYGGRYQIFNDIRGGDFQNDRTNVVTGFDVWNYTPSNSSGNSVQALWNRAYYAINLVNVFLEGMENKGTAVVGDAISKNLQGEARFVRALSYYAMLQLYARPYWDGNGSKPGLPLRLTANTGSGNYDLARSTVAEVYAQILEDLNYAEQNLPEAYSKPELNTTRAHKNTAIAFKTRVYLSMQKYGEVITEANKIVSADAPFKASTGIAHQLQANYATLFSNYTTTESILSMPFSDVEAPGTQNQLGYYYGSSAMNGGNGEYSLLSTGIIANTGWKETDARRAFIVTSGSKKYLNKYPRPTPFTDWAPVMRYSEVLLNLAEAITRSTNTVDARALALLNAVRQRSDATTTFTAGDFADAAALADAILTERRIEFLGEGLAGADLTRLGLPLPAKPGVTAIQPTQQEYIWPISSTELLLNKLCEDN